MESLIEAMLIDATNIKQSATSDINVTTFFMIFSIYIGQM